MHPKCKTNFETEVSQEAYKTEASYRSAENSVALTLQGYPIKSIAELAQLALLRNLHIENTLI
jgi:hypothetical protein